MTRGIGIMGMSGALSILLAASALVNVNANHVGVLPLASPTATANHIHNHNHNHNHKVIKASSSKLHRRLRTRQLQSSSSGNTSIPQILANLFDATSGDDWKDTTGWYNLDTTFSISADPNSYCSWNGITCHDVNDSNEKYGMIHTLDLSQNRLGGNLPDAIWELPYLTELVLRGNPELSVDFTNVKRARSLEHLNVSNTIVTSFDGLENSEILEFHITGCGLTGTIPSQIFTLSKLQYLYANYNYFTGAIPNTIGNLVNLQELYLFENDLSGSFPNDISAFTQLQVLVLSNNDLSGPLPTAELNNLSQLSILALANNSLTGPLPSLSNMNNLRQVFLQNNYISGSIPSDFLWSAPKGEIVTVDLSNNEVSGVLSGMRLGEFTRLNLYVGDNRITALDDNLCNGNDGWNGGNVEEFGCNAILCPIGTFSAEGRATPNNPCEDCPSATASDAADFMGASECNARQLQILIDFYDALEGDFWKEMTNSWFGEEYYYDYEAYYPTSECTWTGIECSDNGDIVSIQLSGMKLRGTPPSDLFLLPQLQILDLSNNVLEWKFDGIFMAQNLRVLDLSSTGMTMSMLNNVDQLYGTSIQELYLGSNRLEGPLPTDLLELESLEVLMLAHNHLSGPLPPTISNLINLRSFKAYDNEFTGTLPAEIGLLGDTLEELILSENDFTGDIPEILNEMPFLEILAIRQSTSISGGLTGLVPHFYYAPNLEYIDLSHNSLSGNIPDSFLGNSTLADDYITVNLSHNIITGAVPEYLYVLNYLDINLAENQITSIPQYLCDLTANGWMSSLPAGYYAGSCSAILCPAGSFNVNGRASQSQGCIPCEDSASEYMGATSCEAVGDDEVWWILEELYISTNGGEWTNNEGWLQDGDVCSWYGITCDSDNVNIIEINLSENNLYGTPSPLIFNIPRLTTLNLSSNAIDFDFVGIEAAGDLRTLYLSETQVSSMQGIGKATSLNYLHLTGSYISGMIPEELYDLIHLRGLFLNYNRLTGRLSTKIGNLVALEELYLLENELEGVIPASIGKLVNLKVLALSENNFGGSLPDSLNDLVNLETLAIQGPGPSLDDATVSATDGDVRRRKVKQSSRRHLKDTSGTTNARRLRQQRGSSGLTGPLPALDRLPNLTGLFLAFNRLEGTIPFHFLSGIIDKSVPLKIELEGNSLSGIVPSSLTQFESLDLYVGGNKFTSIANGLCRMTNWLEGDVGRWNCDAIACPMNTFSEWGRHDDQNECTPCAQNAVSPYVGAFACISEEELREEQERMILQEFFESTGGASWHSKQGWNEDTGSNSISICDYHGVECRGNTNSVQAIHLANNGLVGSVPSSIFDLPNLTEFGVAGNDITIDVALAAMPTDGFCKLEYLNIDDTNTPSLSGMEHCPNLAVLHVSRIGLTSFPVLISTLTNLEVVYLSDKFESPLPDLSNLTELAFFQCQKCGLSGTIDAYWGETMSELQYLNLAGNRLSGPFPTPLAELKSLKYLDLSDQVPRGGGITGELPSFANAVNLQELYLNQNKLSGVIPSDFLKNAGDSGSNGGGFVTVDLRYNYIFGSVPASLLSNNFDNLTLLLAENELDGIDDEICTVETDMPMWNGGDMEEFGCDGLLCEPGFYSPTGRVSRNNVDGGESLCRPCEDMTDEDTQNYYGSTTCGSSVQLQALDHMYYALGGPDWEKNDEWMENDLYCNWYGITCDDSGDIVEIVLSENNLVGDVPTALFDISTLATLNLKANALSFDMDGMERLTNLHTLNLSELGLTTVAGIGRAISLVELHLTSNELTKFPEDLYQLTNLESLFMNYNQMEGKLSSSGISQWSKMTELFLFRNKLSGSIPDELGGLKKLVYLALGENDFTGVLPSSISNLQNIEVIAIQHKRADADASDVVGFTGTVPAFDNNPNLKTLYLSHHEFSGKLPHLFLTGIRDKSAPMEVDLSDNQISGSLPSTLNNFSNLQLYLANNRITELDSSFCDMSGWMNGEVLDHGCDSILCPMGTYSPYGRQTNEGPSCEICPFTFTAPYFGSTECLADSTDYNEREILTMLYESTNGDKWLNVENWQEDSVSICDWHGVYCETSTGGEKHVTEIHLPSNKLQGMIPPQVFNLPALKMFNVRDNKINIEFIAMAENPALKEMYIDYTNVSSLLGIGRAKNLRTLHIQENNFLGESLPEELFDLVKLKHLYMSGSNIGGQLSSSFGKLTKLIELYSHANALVGEIPEEITQLTKLEVLVLSENRFVGPLPAKISNLTSLQSLFIDSFTHESAGLSGPLPSFQGMPELKQISLNENSLTGSIPENFLSDDLSANRNMKDRNGDRSLATLTRLNEKITVGLMGNRIEGSIPSSLAAFQRLNIDLSDNLITDIDPAVCENAAWMGSDVGSFGCDAILCPVGTFNQYGRQTNIRNPCQQCDGDGSEQSDFLGATKCQAEVKAREREILSFFYRQCGGDEWKTKDNWLDDSKDICTWYGISCSNGGTVESILLGSNNVIGIPPKELFQLENMKYLWLYSNPMDFRFHGIGRAKRLSSLLLDSTGLTSLDGLGDAYQLTDIDVRFNNINGPIPTEISNLVNLETISMSDNQFTGALPSFSRMHRLKSLRMADNELTGILPSFVNNHNIKTLDLSGNMISGRIPSTFLGSVDTSSPMYIDLSKNRIEGTFPGNLARFNDMTIYLKDNFLMGIDQEVCSMDEWNGKDVGSHGCNAIACPPGTYAPGKGRESLGGSPCQECEEATFYGQSMCTDLLEFYSSASSKYMHTALSIVVATVTVFVLV